ncbi:putative Ser Thr protein phosphatase family protein [Rosellinia necatrix]|uniref:Putative Ser Thr protein phosphatase family protein n=1 Tax=Rosellinia necatrix TaxID=77044 RepID=A0A1W2TIT0_ROSNE|nr:putative Ser Thr protein phosphatase family protein [Rosellinia necatrix]
MASNSLRQHQRPRNRTLAAVAFAFIVSAVLLGYMRPGPIFFTSSSRPALNELGELAIDDAMAPATAKHNKDGPKRTYPQISTFPANLLPTIPSDPHEAPRRLIIIGDVHGHLKPLEVLLKKAEFSASRDTVVFAGDLVNKGPDSVGVVALAMRIGAFSVRGNHEDHVLRICDRLDSKRREREQKRGRRAEIDNNVDDDDEEETEETDEEDDVSDDSQDGIPVSSTALKGTGEESDDVTNSDAEQASENEQSQDVGDGIERKKKNKKNKHKKGKGKGKKKTKGGKAVATAKSLKPEQRAWLSELPLILKIGNLGPRYGDVLVVHAGLVPGIPLESQDPVAVMSMRTLLPPKRRHHHPASISDGGSGSSDSQEPMTVDQPEQQQQQQQTETVVDPTYNHERNPMVPSADRDGTPWAKVWTSYQATFAESARRRRHGPHKDDDEDDDNDDDTEPATVVYGHDARAGLQMRRYAFGLDSGCGSDNALTAVIFELAARADGQRRNGEGSVEGAGREEEEEEDDEGEWEEWGAEERSGGGGGGDEQETRERRRRGKLRHRLVSVPCVHGR